MTARPGLPDLPEPDFHSSLTAEGRWTEPTVTAHAEAAYDAGERAGREAEREDPRDEYHTMAELYEYRMLYNAHAANGWRAGGVPVVKSWRHSDGEACFGGGWFIVVADLPGAGQVSNHYQAEHWSLFDVPEVDLPPEYDGHSQQEAADRLRRALNVDHPPRADS